MNKRLISLILTVLVLTSLLLGCSVSDETKKVTGASSKGEKPTIEEQVLLDKEGIKVTALEYATDSIWGDGVKLLVENNTDTNYTVSCEALIVNDCMITDLFSSSVAAGKKSNETLYLSSSELEASGIEVIGKIEVYFRVYNSDNWNGFLSGEYAEIKTSLYDSMSTAKKDDGTELFNSNGVRIVGKSVDEKTFWGKALLLYCENTSGQNVTISVDDMSVNGFMVHPYFVTTIYNGKMVIDAIDLFSSDLESNGITSIENIELNFRIYNSDTYQTIAESGAITMTFN